MSSATAATACRAASPKPLHRPSRSRAPTTSRKSESDEAKSPAPPAQPASDGPPSPAELEVRKEVLCEPDKYFANNEYHASINMPFEQQQSILLAAIKAMNRKQIQKAKAKAVESMSN